MPTRKPTRTPRGEVSAILHAARFAEDGSLDPTNRDLLRQYYSGDVSRWAELRQKAEKTHDRDSLLLLAGGLLVLNALTSDKEIPNGYSSQLGQELLRLRESIDEFTPGQQG